MSEDEPGGTRNQGTPGEGRSGLSLSREESENRSARRRARRSPGVYGKLQQAVQAPESVVARWFIPLAGLVVVLLIVIVAMHLSRGGELDALNREVAALRAQAEASNIDGLSSEIDRLAARVEGFTAQLADIDELNADLQALEAEVTQQNEAIDAVSGRMDELEQASNRSGTGEPSTSPAGQASQQAGDGNWVVNLITVADSAAAEQVRKGLAEAGFEARIVPVTIDGKALRRVVVGGFESFEAATGAAPAMKEHLELSDDPWITRE
ncbi:MAG: SPOR domain-containing protein [Gammaproteobacteria bacterium]|nr:SPOR domain-containing protein [Gammaproteobacteria bacterium]